MCRSKLRCLSMNTPKYLNEFTSFFKKRGDHVCYLFKRYNVLSVFDLYLDALVKEILDQIAKVSPLNFT